MERIYLRTQYVYIYKVLKCVGKLWCEDLSELCLYGIADSYKR